MQDARCEAGPVQRPTAPTRRAGLPSRRRSGAARPLSSCRRPGVRRASDDGHLPGGGRVRGADVVDPGLARSMQHGEHRGLARAALGAPPHARSGRGSAAASTLLRRWRRAPARTWPRTGGGQLRRGRRGPPAAPARPASDRGAHQRQPGGRRRTGVERDAARGRRARTPGPRSCTAAGVRSVTTIAHRARPAAAAPSTVRTAGSRRTRSATAPVSSRASGVPGAMPASWRDLGRVQPRRCR